MHWQSLLLTDGMYPDIYRLLHIFVTVMPSDSVGLISMVQDV